MKLICVWLPFSQSVDVRIVRAVDNTDTAISRNWAPIQPPSSPFGRCPYRMEVRQIAAER
jgi:hypothetical protein